MNETGERAPDARPWFRALARGVSDTMTRIGTARLGVADPCDSLGRWPSVLTGAGWLQLADVLGAPPADVLSTAAGDATTTRAE